MIISADISIIIAHKISNLTYCAIFGFSVPVQRALYAAAFFTISRFTFFSEQK